MAINPFSNLFGASALDEASAQQYSMLGTDEPSLGQMAATSAPMDTGFQPMAFGESGGSVAIDPTNPTIQASDREAQAGFPIVPALIGAGSVPFTQLVTSGGAIPPAPTGQLGRVLRGARTVAGTARTVGAAPITINPVLGTAAALLAAEEAPKAFGSEKSTSEILTELAATTPEERAGAAEYAALGANLPGLGGEPVIDAGVVSKPPTPNLSQFMRYDDAAETEQFVDPQGRLRIRMKDTKELAPQYSNYESEAGMREQRLRDQAALRARFPGGVPVSSRLAAMQTGTMTDAERRRFAKGLMRGASEEDIADSLEIANRYNLDPRTGQPTSEPDQPTKLEQETAEARLRLINAQIEAAGKKDPDKLARVTAEADRLISAKPPIIPKEARQAYILGQMGADVDTILGAGITSTPKTFSTAEEAEAANLPKGTEVIINGRRAVIE
jgi:hypothetical protein